MQLIKSLIQFWQWLVGQKRVFFLLRSNTTIIEFTTCFYEFSEYESTNISTVQKENKYWSKKAFFSQLSAFKKIKKKLNITQCLVENICRFVFGKFVKTCNQLDLWNLISNRREFCNAVWIFGPILWLLNASKSYDTIRWVSIQKKVS